MVRAPPLVNARRCVCDIECLRRLLEGEVRGMAVARRALRELLSVRVLGDSGGNLLYLYLRLLARRWELLVLCGRLVVHYRRFPVSRTHHWAVSR